MSHYNDIKSFDKKYLPKKVIIDCPTYQYKIRKNICTVILVLKVIYLQNAIYIYTTTLRLQLYKINVHNHTVHIIHTYTTLIYTTNVFISVYLKCFRRQKLFICSISKTSLIFLSHHIYNILHLIENLLTKLAEIYLLTFIYIYFIHV